jgi:hypothetical protein
MIRMMLRSSLFVLLGVGEALAQATEASAIARAAATELGEGRSAALHARLADDLKVALSEDLLRDPLIKDLVAGAGLFEKIDAAPVCRASQGPQMCVVPMLYAKARIRVRFAIDAAGRVAGIYVEGREAR